jgi:hypothetical protein
MNHLVPGLTYADTPMAHNLPHPSFCAIGIKTIGLVTG